uniref:HECT-type E3 ubiquitin transferase n=1 Tax=Macrostomum lignano TaxID=282301 RepID=A0A1I8F8V8_9PLAT
TSPCARPSSAASCWIHSASPKHRTRAARSSTWSKGADNPEADGVRGCLLISIETAASRLSSSSSNRLRTISAIDSRVGGPPIAPPGSTGTRLQPPPPSPETADPLSSSENQQRRHQSYLSRCQLHLSVQSDAPDEWQQCQTPQGQDPRVSTVVDSAALGPLPEGWEERRTATGKLLCQSRGQNFSVRRSQAAAAAAEIPAAVKKQQQQRSREIWDLRRRLLFRGEEGLDYGGVAREWFYLLSQQMLNPAYGLFQYARDDVYLLQINPDSGVNSDHLTYFHFVWPHHGPGTVPSSLLGRRVHPAVVQATAGPSSQPARLESVDPMLYNSLCWILNNDITGVLEHTFSVEHQSFGAMEVHELIPGGKSVPVTQDNSGSMCSSTCDGGHRGAAAGSAARLPRAACRPTVSRRCEISTERELELMLNGLGRIDPPSTAACCQFVTGSSRLPLQGFSALRGSVGGSEARLFTLQLVRDLDTRSLPVAHTCFNRLDLPVYESAAQLRAKLLQAVEETCGFNVE